jgi:hypothetical protein
MPRDMLAGALVDFEAVLDDPSYTIEFSGWHQVIGTKTAVCLALGSCAGFR